MSAGALKKIEAKLQSLAPEELRYQVLTALRRFRISWVELGRMLTTVAKSGQYQDWGYADFEVYCTSELALKKPTVRKLMISYRYMHEREPERLNACESYDGQGVPPSVPDYQTVELLHRASENAEVEAEDKSRFHRLAFSDEMEDTALRKEIRGALHGVQEQDVSEEISRERELQDIKRTCRVLRRKIADSRCLTMGLRERFERLLAELEKVE